jgi:hypothetical protein
MASSALFIFGIGISGEAAMRARLRTEMQAEIREIDAENEGNRCAALQRQRALKQNKK